MINIKLKYNIQVHKNDLIYSILNSEDKNINNKICNLYGFTYKNITICSICYT